MMRRENSIQKFTKSWPSCHSRSILPSVREREVSLKYEKEQEAGVREDWTLRWPSSPNQWIGLWSRVMKGFLFFFVYCFFITILFLFWCVSLSILKSLPFLGILLACTQSTQRVQWEKFLLCIDTPRSHPLFSHIVKAPMGTSMHTTTTTTNTVSFEEDGEMSERERDEIASKGNEPRSKPPDRKIFQEGSRK